MKKFTYRIEKRPKSNSSGTATIDFYGCQVFNKTGSHKYFEPIHKTPYDALIFAMEHAGDERKPIGYRIQQIPVPKESRSLYKPVLVFDEFEVDFPYNLASEKEIEQYVAGKFPELKKL